MPESEIDFDKIDGGEPPPEKDANDLFSRFSQQIATAAIELALKDPRFLARHEDHGLEPPPPPVFMDIVDELARPGALERAAKFPTGIHIIDSALSGGVIQSGLTIIAGRTSCGKSSLLRQIAANMAGFGVCYTSLEDDESDTRRKLCTIYGSGSLEDGLARFRAERPRLLLNHITTDVDRLIVEIERHAREDGIKVAVIDQLSWLHSEQMSDDIYREVSRCVSELKLLAKRARLSVICAAQINRQGARAETEGERIGLHHLRDSGRIEENADAVIVIQGLDATTGRMDADLLKNRQGARDRSMSVILDFPSGCILDDPQSPIVVVLDSAKKRDTHRRPVPPADISLEDFARDYLTDYFMYPVRLAVDILHEKHDFAQKKAISWVNKMLGPLELNTKIDRTDESDRTFGPIQATRRGASNGAILVRRTPAALNPDATPAETPLIATARP